MSRDIPMLFSAAMVRALFDGRKTQTRRLMSPQPRDGFVSCNFNKEGGHWEWLGTGLMYGDPEKLPRVSPGDRIWGRERWRVGAWHYGNAEIAVDYDDGPIKEWCHVDDSDMLCRLIDQSRADAANANVRLNDLTSWEYTWAPGQGPCRWRSSIHMPRWASRFTLLVTDVRVQRLQDISYADCVAEGCDPIHMQPGGPHGNPSDGWLDYRAGFQRLWDSLNADRAPWESNPWVYATSFEFVPANIDDLEVAA